jgi:tryptophanyl-tRNA synthetase
MSQCTQGSTIEAIFGLTSTSTENVPSSSVGQFIWPIYQSIPAFASSFKNILKSNCMCFVPMAIDQDPYFRLARDFAGRLHKQGFIKPAAIHSEFLPALTGVESKMSSTEIASVIFLTDSPNQIKNKIKKHCFSGGAKTLEEHRIHGANLKKDVAFQYLLYFLDDDEKLADIAKKYSSGEMLTSEVKNVLIEIIQEFVSQHQQRISELNKETLDHFYNADKQFNNTRPIRESIALLTDEEYLKMGINFDRYFGTL